MAWSLLLVLDQLVDLLLEGIVLRILVVVALLGDAVILAPAVVLKALAVRGSKVHDFIIYVARVSRLELILFKFDVHPALISR